MRRILLGIVFIFSIIIVNSQCITNLDLSTWQRGGSGNGNWVVQAGGTRVHQTINGDPTFFYSPFDLMNVHISGRFRSTDFDDDWMGFVFSFLNPLGFTNDFDCWIFDWKQDFQGGAPRGMAINRANGLIPSYGPTLNNHTNTPQFTVVQNTFGGPGWSWNNYHDFDLYLTYTRAIIYIDGTLTFDVQDCFKPGRFGFYNYSQKDCYYDNFQYSLYVDFNSPQRACVNQTANFTFANTCVTTLGQYQSVTWNYGDGSPPQVINNPTIATVNGSHVYTTAGNYTVTFTITDFNGCSATASHTINVANPITLASNLVPPACNGAANGTVGVIPSGGFGGYTYSWSNANSQQTINGAAAGTYSVTVTDGTCATTAQYTLNQPTALTATTSHTDAPCGGNGTATITISGGTPPYTGVNWAGTPATSGVPTSMPAGMWIADFRDSRGCSALLQYRETISQLPCGITTNLTTTNVSCFGGSNGTATLTVTGGSGGSIAGWTASGSTFTKTGLAAGTYTYNYVDANPARNFTFTVTITAPGAAMVASLSTVPITCTGANNGQALASVVSGGTPVYSYAWSGGHPNSPVATNLAPGPISVTITDNAGCSASATGTVSGVPSLAMSFTTVMDSCYHGNKGAALATVSGGMPPYVYEWNNFRQDSANTNIAAGTYTLTVTDYNGCSATGSATVPGPSSALSSSYVVTGIACAGDTAGTFNVTVSGGTPSYTYAWTPNTLSGPNQSNLTAGIYSYTVTDAYGCQVFGLDTVKQPDSVFTATSSHTDILCNGEANGTITITTSGGTQPYWYQGFPIPAGTNTLPGLPAGTYVDSITDNSGCKVILTETIVEPSALVLSEQHVDVLCNGDITGYIDLTVTGGTPPYTYSWSNGATTEDINNLPAGVYVPTCWDANSCSATLSAITISEPSALNITETHTDVSCYGASTGEIDITVTGGTAPYSFDWNDGPTTEDRTSILAGAYTVTASDANLCSVTLTVTINQPDSLEVTTSHTDVTCHGANDGTITITISGGTAPYSFLGNPVPAGTTVLTALPPSTYAGNITDDNGCSVAVSETITEPLSQSLTVSGTDNPCFGATQGTASATFVNPTGIPTYEWTGGLTGDNITGLAAGTYVVTATDQNGCTLTDSVEVNQPAAEVLIVTAVDAACHAGNGSATVTEPTTGTPPYVYVWSDSSTGQTVSLPAGNYTVSSTDANTCQQTASLTINEPPQILIEETHTNELCFGDTVGTITLTVSNGVGTNYTFVWQPNVSSTNTASNLAAGTYTVTVTDEAGCVLDTSIIITEPAQIVINTVADDVNCFGESSGSIVTTASGGNPPYSYEWNDLVQTQDRTNIPAGTYTVTVTDDNSCTASATAVVNGPNELLANTSFFDVSCYQSTDGTITVFGSGGLPAYTYSLSGGTQNSTGIFTGLAAGSYTVTVTDANNCEIVESVSISEPDPVVISTIPATIEVNLGETVQLQAVTNQPPGNEFFTWQPNFGLSCYDCNNPSFSGNESVVYNVTVATDRGCTGSAEVHVTVVPSYDIFIPNAFAPNGSGQNTVWRIFGNLPGIKQLNVMVFNRWGEKVFESNDINFGWDGTYKGQPAPQGVYSYVAKFVWLDNHSDNDYKGTITLIR